MIKTSSFGPVMLDVVGLELTDEDKRRIRHPLTGGVILFARNFKNREQLVALTQAIKQEKPNILIAVDHEGGRVQRFREDGFTVLPAMRSLGELYEKNAYEAKQLAMSVGYVLAAELLACGVNYSFTPVLDLDFGFSQVIGNRSFHKNAEYVSDLAQSLQAGLLLAGMSSCGKHFPGHGYATGDSHTEIPVDNRPFQTILEQDILPYKRLAISLGGVMPAHVIFPSVDSQPAGFSKKWLSILRNDCQFDGVIFSDDLSMAGAHVAGDIIARAKAALTAGCDMVLVCNDPQSADVLLENLTIDNTVSLVKSAQRVERLIFSHGIFNWDTLQEDKRYQLAKSMVNASKK